MPVKAVGKRVVKASSGKTEFTAKNKAHAKKVAAARNIAHAKAKGKRIPPPRKR